MTDENWQQYEFQLTQLMASDMEIEEFNKELTKLRRAFNLPDEIL